MMFGNEESKLNNEKFRVALSTPDYNWSGATLNYSFFTIH